MSTWARITTTLALAAILSACNGTATTQLPGTAVNSAATSNARNARAHHASYGTNQYIYGGCGIFPPGDIFNHDVTGYKHDHQTSQMFAKAPQGNFAYWDDQGSEQVN